MGLGRGADLLKQGVCLGQVDDTGDGDNGGGCPRPPDADRVARAHVQVRRGLLGQQRPGGRSAELAGLAGDGAGDGLNALRQTPGGEQASLIGGIREEPAAAVLVTTLYGGSRIVDMLVGDPLPRIC